MGRTEPSKGLAPPPQRRNLRAKRARETLNRTIPILLSGHKRARDGIAAAELIVDPPAASVLWPKTDPQQVRNEEQSKSSRKRSGKRVNATTSHAIFETFNENTKPVQDRFEKTTREPPKVRVWVSDTVTAASLLSHATTHQPSNVASNPSLKNNVAILNMASPLRAGGGFLNGATSQEEHLCMRSTLLPSLREDFYRLPEVGGIWTPQVLIFRDGTSEAADLNPKKRFWVDVISSAPLRFPDVDFAKNVDGSSADEDCQTDRRLSEEDRAHLRKKMRGVLRTLQAKGVEKVVLGAWGCGAYGTPVSEVSRAWHDVILGTAQAKGKKHDSTLEKWFGLREVVFAINQRAMATSFACHWPGGIEAEALLEQVHDRELKEVERKREDSEELRQTITQLDKQIAGARHETLKASLRTIKEKLAKDLGRINVSSKEADSSDMRLSDNPPG
jgi:uncharacterized protein (TIGR02452 family)